MGLTTKPFQLAKRQALAAVGQVHLMKYYEDFFSALGLVSEGQLGALSCMMGREGQGGVLRVVA